MIRRDYPDNGNSHASAPPPAQRDRPHEDGTAFPTDELQPQWAKELAERVETQGKELEQLRVEFRAANARGANAVERLNHEQIAVLNQMMQRMSGLQRALATQRRQAERLVVAMWITEIAIAVLLLAAMLSRVPR